MHSSSFRLALALALSACVASPRTEGNLAHRAEPLSFSGLFEVPDIDLDVEAFSYSKNAWVRFATVRTRASDPVIDASGRPYFRYSASLVLPQGKDYWSPRIESGRIEARTRVVHGERVLAMYGADAEACARAAHATGRSERAALTECASKDTHYARVFVAACGSEGKVCCTVTDGRSACAAALSCEQALCTAPSYAPPVVRNHQVDLSVPAGYVLRDAVLVLDDTSGGKDTELALVADFRPSAGVRREQPHPSLERLTFDLPLWKPGINRFFVRGYAQKGEARRLVESATWQLSYEVPRAFGHAPRTRSFRLPPAFFARTMRGCHGLLCKDKDGDGLNDLWENVALHQLRPRLLLDHADALFKRKQDVVTVMTSVRPLMRDGQEYVVLASVVAFSRDYGYLVGWAHPGDTETFGMLYRVEADDSLRWVASVTKGHTCLTCSPSYLRYPQEFAEDGTPLVFVEKNKHGLWQSGRACRSKSAFSCRGDRSMRPDANNIGDDAPGGPRMLVDAFDGMQADGPFAEVSRFFPGDAVWTASRARVKGKFCGGQRDCSRSQSATMPGDLIARLCKLFEHEKF